LGIKKISQFLRRMWFLPVSRETVRRTLHQQQLLKKPKSKPPRNPPKPRFFERSTPNQMWQTDIFTFRLGGKNAYLIGFIDRSLPLRGRAGRVS
jgi:transposase InsO family protein